MTNKIVKHSVCEKYDYEPYYMNTDLKFSIPYHL